MPGSSPDLIQGDYELKVDVETGSLTCLCRTDIQPSLAGLQQHDFIVYEDGVLQNIQQFLPTEAPFNLLLLMDVSGSTGAYLKMMKHAAIEFTRQIKPGDRVAVATFNSRVKLVQEFTDDLDKAEHAIKRMRSGGGTAFYDALMTGVTQYMDGVQGRSAIVVFTDGIDNRLDGMPESGSRTSFDDLYRRVQETDMIIYTIFLNTEKNSPHFSRSSGPSGSGWPGRRGRGFSSRSPSLPSLLSPVPPYGRSDDPVLNWHGTAPDDRRPDRWPDVFPTKTSELSGVYSEIADDLRIQYQLGYNSSNRSHDGKWRSIRVEPEGNPDAVVRTRRLLCAPRRCSGHSIASFGGFRWPHFDSALQALGSESSRNTMALATSSGGASKSLSSFPGIVAQGR